MNGARRHRWSFPPCYFFGVLLDWNAAGSWWWPHLGGELGRNSPRRQLNAAREQVLHPEEPGRHEHHPVGARGEQDKAQTACHGGTDSAARRVTMATGDVRGNSESATASGPCGCWISVLATIRGMISGMMAT